MNKFCTWLAMSVVVACLTGCEMTPVGDGNSGDGGNGGGDMNTNGGDMVDDMNTNGSMTGDMNTNGDTADDNGADNVAKFQDPDSDFETTEVRDVDGEIMQFDTSTNELVWQADGTRIAQWTVEGNSLLFGFSEFRARFGTEDGQRRAYFTEVVPPTICDLVVNNGALSIFSTTTQVPQE